MTRDEVETHLGELLLVGVPGSELSPELRGRLLQLGPSGVVFFARNFPDPAAAAGLARAVHETIGTPERPALVAIDEEGGIVSRLSQFWEVPPNPRAVAASGGPPLVKDLAYRTGRRLLALGVNLNFAPCLDIHSNPANPVIGVRSFGETVSQVTACGRAALEGFEAAGLIGAAKHFPGHGDTSLDSHVALPRCEAGLMQLQVRELKPFEAAVQWGVPMVMTSHVLFPALDPDPQRPCTISRAIVTGLLRERMDYGGVVVTDALEMAGVRGIADWGEIAVRALEAGADLLLYSELEPGPDAALRALRDALQSGRLAPERLGASLERIRTLRAGSAATPPPLTPTLLAEARDRVPPSELDRIASGALRVLRQGAGGVPLRGLVEVLEVDRPESPAPMVELLRAHGMKAREQGADPAGWPKHVDGSALLTLAARGSLSPENERTARAWLRRFPETVTVACLNPHVADRWEEVRTLLATFDNTPASRRALAARLAGRPV
ncbi:MAG TPA: glycoside hydrolase family 3 N-terminal domain-containing protein [Candidatus Eisenbacteria bacterium]|jgi:beta-N-acetylhexosaminidase